MDEGARERGCRAGVWAQAPLASEPLAAESQDTRCVCFGSCLWPRGRGSAVNTELRLARLWCIFLHPSSKAALGFTDVWGTLVSCKVL